MEVRVKRFPHTQTDDEFISHADRKKHKYVAKVELKNGKFRYFYDKKEYQEYLNGKKKSLADTVSKTISNVLDKTFDGKSKSKAQAKGKKKADKILAKYKDLPSNDFFLLLDRRLITMAMSFVSKLFKNIFKEEKKHKYIAKVELPNGKYRYFYKQEEYDAYRKRLKYQQNEPGFMKKVKDIPDDKVYTAKEDVNKVNETYSPFDAETSTNCANCSAAYELRRRGYDVEAKANGGKDDYNGNGDRVFDYFENASMFGIYGDGTTIEHSEEFVRGVWNGGVDKNFFRKYEDEIDFMNEPQRYTSKSIEKGILANSPPGSRGMIDVEWKSGGAHSIVYEVDKKGKVTIRDSQTYDEYSLYEIAHTVQKVRISRTDNLQLKEDILSAVVPNENNERSYYIDNGIVLTR